MKKHLILSTICLIYLQSCGMTEYDIKEQTWKYLGGANIGDWIDFKNSIFSLSNDTIYSNKMPVARIVSSRTSTFGSKRTLVFESIDNKQKGTYIEK